MDFRVDFTSENVLPDGSNFGYVGEHNAATLVITPPKKMTDNAEILYVCLACEVGREYTKIVVRSEMYEKAAEIRVPLWAQATIGEEGKLQLEGYDGNNNILIKSELISYVLSPSANGVQSATDMNGGSLAETVAKNSKRIEELALNGGGKVKKVFIPYDESYAYGCYTFTESNNTPIYVSNNFLDEHGINEICPVDLTVLWEGQETSVAELNKKAITGEERPAFINLMNPRDIDNVGTDKIIGTIYNAIGGGSKSLADFAGFDGTYFGGVYLYYFDKIEVVE